MILPAYKGTYRDTLEAGLRALDAGNAPALLQVYEVGTTTMTRNVDAFVPIDTLMQQTRSTTNRDYLPLITSYFSNANGELLSLPYNVSTPVLFLNMNVVNELGLEDTVSTHTWNDVEALLQVLRDQGQNCPFTTS